MNFNNNHDRNVVNKVKYVNIHKDAPKNVPIEKVLFQHFYSEKLAKPINGFKAGETIEAKLTVTRRYVGRKSLEKNSEHITEYGYRYNDNGNKILVKNVTYYVDIKQDPPVGVQREEVIAKESCKERLISSKNGYKKGDKFESNIYFVRRFVGKDASLKGAQLDTFKTGFSKDSQFGATHKYFGSNDSGEKSFEDFTNDDSSFTDDTMEFMNSTSFNRSSNNLYPANTHIKDKKEKKKSLRATSQELLKKKPKKTTKSKKNQSVTSKPTKVKHNIKDKDVEYSGDETNDSNNSSNSEVQVLTLDKKPKRRGSTSKVMSGAKERYKTPKVANNTLDNTYNLNKSFNSYLNDRKSHPKKFIRVKRSMGEDAASLVDIQYQRIMFNPSSNKNEVWLVHDKISPSSIKEDGVIYHDNVIYRDHNDQPFLKVIKPIAGYNTKSIEYFEDVHYLPQLEQLSYEELQSKYPFDKNAIINKSIIIPKIKIVTDTLNQLCVYAYRQYFSLSTKECQIKYDLEPIQTDIPIDNNSYFLTFKDIPSSPIRLKSIKSTKCIQDNKAKQIYVRAFITQENIDSAEKNFEVLVQVPREKLNRDGKLILNVIYQKTEENTGRTVKYKEKLEVNEHNMFSYQTNGAIKYIKRVINLYTLNVDSNTNLVHAQSDIAYLYEPETYEEAKARHRSRRKLKSKLIEVTKELYSTSSGGIDKSFVFNQTVFEEISPLDTEPFESSSSIPTLDEFITIPSERKRASQSCEGYQCRRTSENDVNIREKKIQNNVRRRNTSADSVTYNHALQSKQKLLFLANFSPNIDKSFKLDYFSKPNFNDPKYQSVKRNELGHYILKVCREGFDGEYEEDLGINPFSVSNLTIPDTFIFKSEDNQPCLKYIKHIFNNKTGRFDHIVDYQLLEEIKPNNDVMIVTNMCDFDSGSKSECLVGCGDFLKMPDRNSTVFLNIIRGKVDSSGQYCLVHSRMLVPTNLLDKDRNYRVLATSNSSGTSKEQNVGEDVYDVNSSNCSRVNTNIRLVRRSANIIAIGIDKINNRFKCRVEEMTIYAPESVIEAKKRKEEGKILTPRTVKVVRDIGPTSSGSKAHVIESYEVYDYVCDTDSYSSDIQNVLDDENIIVPPPSVIYSPKTDLPDFNLNNSLVVDSKGQKIIQCYIRKSSEYEMIKETVSDDHIIGPGYIVLSKGVFVDNRGLPCIKVVSQELDSKTGDVYNILNHVPLVTERSENDKVCVVKKKLDQDTGAEYDMFVYLKDLNNDNSKKSIIIKTVASKKKKGSSNLKNYECYHQISSSKLDKSGVFKMFLYNGSVNPGTGEFIGQKMSKDITAQNADTLNLKGKRRLIKKPVIVYRVRMNSRTRNLESVPTVEYIYEPESLSEAISRDKIGLPLTKKVIKINKPVNKQAKSYNFDTLSYEEEVYEDQTQSFQQIPGADHSLLKVHTGEGDDVLRSKKVQNIGLDSNEIESLIYDESSLLKSKKPGKKSKKKKPKKKLSTKKSILNKGNRKHSSHNLSSIDEVHHNSFSHEEEESTTLDMSDVLEDKIVERVSQPQKETKPSKTRRNHPSPQKLNESDIREGYPELLSSDSQGAYDRICFSGNGYILPSMSVYMNNDGEPEARLITTDSGRNRLVQTRILNSISQECTHYPRMCIRDMVISRKNKVLECLANYIPEYLRTNTDTIRVKCLRKRWNHELSRYEMYECFTEPSIAYRVNDTLALTVLQDILNEKKFKFEQKQYKIEINSDNFQYIYDYLPKYIRKRVIVVKIRKNEENGQPEAYEDIEDIYEPEITIVGSSTDNICYVPSVIDVVRLRRDPISGEFEEFGDRIQVFDQKYDFDIQRRSSGSNTDRIESPSSLCSSRIGSQYALSSSSSDDHNVFVIRSKEKQKPAPPLEKPDISDSTQPLSSDHIVPSLVKNKGLRKRKVNGIKSSKLNGNKKGSSNRLSSKKSTSKRKKGHVTKNIEKFNSSSSLDETCPKNETQERVIKAKSSNLPDKNEPSVSVPKIDKLQTSKDGLNNVDQEEEVIKFTTDGDYTLDLSDDKIDTESDPKKGSDERNFAQKAKGTIKTRPQESGKPSAALRNTKCSDSNFDPGSVENSLSSDHNKVHDNIHSFSNDSDTNPLSTQLKLPDNTECSDPSQSINEKILNKVNDEAVHDNGKLYSDPGSVNHVTEKDTVDTNTFDDNIDKIHHNNCIINSAIPNHTPTQSCDVSDDLYRHKGVQSAELQDQINTSECPTNEDEIDQVLHMDSLSNHTEDSSRTETDEQIFSLISDTDDDVNIQVFDKKDENAQRVPFEHKFNEENYISDINNFDEHSPVLNANTTNDDVGSDSCDQHPAVNSDNEKNDMSFRIGDQHSGVLLRPSTEEDEKPTDIGNNDSNIYDHSPLTNQKNKYDLHTSDDETTSSQRNGEDDANLNDGNDDNDEYSLQSSMIQSIKSITGSRESDIASENDEEFNDFTEGKQHLDGFEQFETEQPSITQNKSSNGPVPPPSLEIPHMFDSSHFSPGDDQGPQEEGYPLQYSQSIFNNGKLQPSSPELRRPYQYGLETTTSTLMKDSTHGSQEQSQPQVPNSGIMTYSDHLYLHPQMDEEEGEVDLHKTHTPQTSKQNNDMTGEKHVDDSSYEVQSQEESGTSSESSDSSSQCSYSNDSSCYSSYSYSSSGNKKGAREGVRSDGSSTEDKNKVQLENKNSFHNQDSECDTHKEEAVVSPLSPEIVQNSLDTPLDGSDNTYNFHNNMSFNQVCSVNSVDAGSPEMQKFSTVTHDSLSDSTTPFMSSSVVQELRPPSGKIPPLPAIHTFNGLGRKDNALSAPSLPDAPRLNDLGHEYDPLHALSSPDIPSFNGSIHEKDTLSAPSLPDIPRFNGSAHEKDTLSAPSLPDIPSLNGSMHEENTLSAPSLPDAPRFNDLGHEYDPLHALSSPDILSFNGSMHEENTLSAPLLPDAPRFNDLGHEYDPLHALSSPDIPSFNGLKHENNPQVYDYMSFDIPMLNLDSVPCTITYDIPQFQDYESSILAPLPLQIINPSNSQNSQFSYDEPTFYPAAPPVPPVFDTDLQSNYNNSNDTPFIQSLSSDELSVDQSLQSNSEADLNSLDGTTDGYCVSNLSDNYSMDDRDTNNTQSDSTSFNQDFPPLPEQDEISSEPALLSNYCNGPIPTLPALPVENVSIPSQSSSMRSSNTGSRRSISPLNSSNQQLPFVPDIQTRSSPYIEE